MKKICGIALAALLAACGTDGNGKGDGGGGGSGGSGGSGGDDTGPLAPVAVENDAGRTFGGEAMTIIIEEEPGSDIPYVMVELLTTEIPPDGGTSKGFYEVLLRASGDMVANGELVSAALSPREPTVAGAGKVSVGFTDGDGEFGAVRDVISLTIDAGTVTGEVRSSKPEVASSIAGEYTMSCSFREGNTLVPDPDFVSDFCQKFAHRLPAD